MASKADNTNRNVIPNWRDFSSTCKTGELQGCSAQSLILPYFPVDDYVLAWRENNNLAFAGDLLSAAIMNGQKDNKDALDAARFVVERDDICPSSLLSVAKSVLENSNGCIKIPKASEITQKLEYLLTDENQNKEKIKFLRNLINRYPYNPVWYAEIARCFVNLGFSKKAEKYMDIAIHLAPESRYISRAASRLFLHNDDPDKAHYVITHNPSIIADPWLIASEIAINASRGRSSRFIKPGVAMINSSNYSPFSITELASAIGTKELESSRKKGTGFIEKSLIAPNDNSLAQADWLVGNDSSLSFDFSRIRKGTDNFESDARFCFLKQDYNMALNHSIDWIKSAPFAKLPIFFAADMAYTYQARYADAVNILKIGLKANPNELRFQNNLAYAYALNNQTEECDETLKKLLAVTPNDTDVYVCAVATSGLNEFRKKNINEGRSKYKEAINIAQSIGMPINQVKSLVHKAYLNYVREEVIANTPEASKLMESLDELSTGDKRETDALKNSIRKIWDATHMRT